jgi:GntR family transcriptional regulator/MocR family aminotransferase
MLLELSLSRVDQQALQEQIAGQIRALIQTGSLRPGSKLPSSRELAAQCNVSRNTVSHAYDKLISEGYIETVKGIGTKITDLIPDDCQIVESFVTHPKNLARPAVRAPVVFAGETLTLPDRSLPKPAIDFWPGRPNRDHFPIGAWRRLADEVLATSLSKLVEYGDPSGLAELREGVARHVSTSRGYHCSADMVIITAGTQESLNLLAKMFVQKGTGVVVENPCYGSAARTFEGYGAQLFPTAVDADGINTDLLPDDGMSLAYVTPSHQFPTGVSLSTDRRKALLDWSCRTGAYIVEDDYDCDFNYHGRPQLSLSGASECDSVIYLGTFSKALGAGVRTGFLIVPKNLVAVARAVKTMANYGHPWLDQAILAGFLRGDTFQRHLRLIRKAYMDILEQLVRRLTADFGPIDLWGTQNGMHVMWRLPRWVGPAELFRSRLQKAGVHVHTLASGGAYDVSSGYAENSILLGYAALSCTEVATAARLITKVAEAGAIETPWAISRPEVILG